jgi:hypothetical protein
MPVVSSEHRFRLRGKKWRKAFPLDPGQDLGSWIATRAPFAVGCIACNNAGLSTKWAKFAVGTKEWDKENRIKLKFSKLLDHSKTASHKSAVRKLLGLPAEDVLAGAPPVSAFKDVLLAVRAGNAAHRSGIAGLQLRIHKVTQVDGDAMPINKHDVYGFYIYT